MITPAVGARTADADVKTTVFGVPKLARLRMLKNSARNCSLTLSEMAVFFNTDASSSARPGPISVFLPTFPYEPVGGTANAFGLKYWLGVPGIEVPVKAWVPGRTHRVAGVSIIGRIESENRREREPGLQRLDSAYGPSARQLLPPSRHAVR